MKRESRLLKNTAIIGFGTMCTKGVSFLLLPLYTSILTTEEYGTVDLVNTFVTLIAYTLTLQFEAGVFRFLIDFRDNKEKQKEYISTTIFVVTVSLLIGIGAVIIIDLIKPIGYIKYLIFNIITTIYLSVFCQIARGIGNIPIYTLASFISIASQVAFNVLFIVGIDWHIGGMLTASIAGRVLAIITVFFPCKIYKFISIRDFDKDAFKNLMKYSLPLVPNTLCWWLINASNRLIISYFLGTSYNGIYAVANKFPGLFTTITSIFQVSWAENAAETLNSKDRDAYYSKIMSQSMCFIACCCAGVIAILPLIFTFLINENYNETYYHIMILLLSSLMNTWQNLYASLFGALKKTKYIAKFTAITAVVTVSLTAIFMGKFGLYAASVTTLISYLLVTLLYHNAVCKFVKIKYSAKKIIITAIAVLIATVSFLINNTWVSLLSTVAVALISYLLNKQMIFSILGNVKALLLKKRSKNPQE